MPRIRRAGSGITARMGLASHLARAAAVGRFTIVDRPTVFWAPGIFASRYQRRVGAASPPDHRCYTAGHER